MIRPSEQTIQIILEKSPKVDQCLIWKGRVNHKDYGQISYKGRKDFNLHQSTVGRIGSGKRWGHMAGGC